MYRRFLKLLLLLVPAQLALGNSTIYRFEGDRLPYDPAAGWQVHAACDVDCAEILSDGRFILEWAADGRDTVNFSRLIEDDPKLLPPSLWVEWRFRSNNPIHPNFYGCDARFRTDYKAIGEPVYIHADAVVSFGADFFIAGLPFNEFRTYRFESRDGNHFRFSVDGFVFYDGKDFKGTDGRVLQFGGDGGCTLMNEPTRNEWDFIRYGTTGDGEIIVAADPPAGYLNPATYSNLDRFTVTFDQPNYVYIADVAVEVLGNQTAGGSPVVLATRRQDNGPPETVEIVLDRPLPIGQTTRFTFNTGAATSQTVEYTVAIDPHPIIPTTSTWGLVILTLVLLTAGKLYFPLRSARTGE